MASTSTSPAVSAMAQQASQQYLQCRRSVTEKADEIKMLDKQIASVFQQISALSEVSEGHDDMSEAKKAAAKSVGRLEVSLLGVEGDEPIRGATITVTLDPEYEDDEYDTVEEVVEKQDVVVTDEHGNVVTDGHVPEEDGESTPRKLKKTTKITRTVIKKRIKKEPVLRSIAWTASDQSDEMTARTFPISFVFDPVQSREAVLIITVAAAIYNDDDEEPEIVKEIEVPISSLFQDKVLDQWYIIVDEDEVPTSITELKEESVSETVTEEALETSQETEAFEQVTKDSEVKEAIKDGQDTEDKAAPIEEIADKAKTELPEETAKAEDTMEKTEENALEKSEEREKTNGMEDENEKTTAEEKRIDEPKATGSRIHVKASFELSEAETLSLSVVALSKEKQEAEATLQELEREVSVLRTKYERVATSQRRVNVSKPKSNLLSTRFSASSVPMQRKTWYQSSYERVTGFATKHQQLLVSTAMFTGSVCLFHFNGENLLA